MPVGNQSIIGLRPSSTTLFFQDLKIWGTMWCTLRHIIGQPKHPRSNFGNCIFLPRDASAERGYKIACRPSVCLSVCDDQVPWSHTLEYFENNFTAK